VLVEPILRELAGQSLRAIAAELDRRGIKSWSGNPPSPATARGRTRGAATGAAVLFAPFCFTARSHLLQMGDLKPLQHRLREYGAPTLVAAAARSVSYPTEVFPLQ
jgi:hypothetical protein